MNMWPRSLIVVLLASAVLGGGAGNATAAFTQVDTVASATGADSSATKSATATCPAGKRVTGVGGLVSEGGVAGVSGVMIDALRPSATLEWVTVRAREAEGGTAADWTLTAYAVCAPAPAGLTRAMLTSPSSSANKKVVASCPAGKRLLGTGGEVTGAAGQVHLDGLHPDAELTKATVNAAEDETGAGSAWTVSAYAICANPVVGLQRVAVTSLTNSDASRAPVTSCPYEKVLIGTGGMINSPDNEVTLAAMVTEFAPPVAHRTHAVEDTTGTDAEWSVTAYGICAATARLKTVDSAYTPNEVKSPPLVCTDNMHATTVGGQITGALGDAWLGWMHTPDGTHAETLAAVHAGDDAWTLTNHAICLTAVKGASIVSEPGPLDATRAKTATVTCPAGTRVIGAGGQAHDGTSVDGENLSVFLEAIRPGPALTAVTVAARQTAASGVVTWRPRAWAVCAPAPAGLVRVAASSPVGSDEVAVVNARCPVGKHLIGVGGEISGGGERVGLDDLRPDAELMSTSLVATEDGPEAVEDWSATAYGICITR